MKTVRLLFILAIQIAILASCNPVQKKDRNVAASGVKKANAELATGSDGLTVEQHNIKDYLEASNTPGMIRHLYVISPYSGDVIIYSPVDGKVTSSGKRLTSNMTLVDDRYPSSNGQHVMGRIGDDGTYGGANAAPYIYWTDTKGVWHKHMLTGGQIVHVSDQPMSFPKVIINVDPSWADK